MLELYTDEYTEKKTMNKDANDKSQNKTKSKNMSIGRKEDWKTVLKLVSNVSKIDRAGLNVESNLKVSIYCTWRNVYVI